MILLLSIILLLVRYLGFRKLTAAQLPLLTADELARMRSLSGDGLAAAALSFVVQVLVAGLNQLFSWGVTLIGLVVAATFDHQAECIKRRGSSDRLPGTLSLPSRRRLVTYALLLILALAFGVLVYLGD